MAINIYWHGRSKLRLQEHIVAVAAPKLKDCRKSRGALHTRSQKHVTAPCSLLKPIISTFALYWGFISVHLAMAARWAGDPYSIFDRTGCVELRGLGEDGNPYNVKLIMQ